MSDVVDPPVPSRSDILTEWISEFYRQLGWQFDADAGLDEAARASPRGAYESREAALAGQLEAIEGEDAKLASARETAAQRLANISRIDGEIHNDLVTIGEEINRLEAAARVARTEDETWQAFAAGDLGRFNNECDALARLVGHVAAQTFRVPSGDGKTFETHAMINPAEQLMLAGMIQIAMLHCETRNQDQAENSLEAARLKLQEFIKVRTGNTDLSQPDRPEEGGILGRTGEIITMVRAVADDATRYGFAGLADRLTGRAEDLRTKAEAWAPANNAPRTPDVLDKQFESERGELEAIVGTTRTTLARVDELMIEIERLRNAMVINGLAAEALQAGAGMTAFLVRAAREESGQQINNALIDLKSATEAALMAGRNGLLQAEGIDTDKLTNDIDGLKDRHEAFFDLGVASTVKEVFSTPRDAETGEKLRRIDNSDLPRETVEALQLKVKSLELLSQSGSVEAMKMAEAKIAEVTALFDRIDADPELFAKLEKRLDKIDARLTKLETDFEKVEIAKRTELKARAKTARGEFKTANPDDTIAALDDLEAELKPFEATAKAVKDKADTLSGAISGFQERIDKIGKLLKSLPANPDLGYDGSLSGNFGEQTTRLSDLREKNETGSKTSVDEAWDLAVALKQDIERTIGTLVKVAKNQDLTDNETAEMTQFLADAKSGQAENARQASQEKNFKGLQTRLMTGAEAAKKTIAGKDVKGDPTEIDALITELKALDTEMKATKKWADGWDRQEELEQRLTRLKAEADATGSAVSKGLVEVATSSADAVTDFDDVLANFYADHILSAIAGEAELTAALGDDAPDQIRKYFAALRTALPLAAATTLKDKVAIVADAAGSSMQVRKSAREEALKALRTITSYLTGFAPLTVFLQHPFGSATAELAALKKSLPRLELRLLTELKE